MGQNKQKKQGGMSWMFCVLFCLMVLFTLPGNVRADQDVILVLSSGAPPYQQAAGTLRDILLKQERNVRVLLAERLSRQNPAELTKRYSAELWVAIGSRAAGYLHRALPESVSLVYCMVADPDKSGLESGRKNIAGVSVTKTVKEQFEIIQEALPEVRSVAMLYRSSSIKSLQSLVDINAHLPENWILESVDIDTADSMAEAIAELFGRKADLIWTMADSAIYNRATVNSLLLSSLRQEIPVFGFSGSFVKAGAVLGLGTSPALQGEYAAALVLDLLDGKSVVSEPVSSGVSLVINKVVADRMGLTFSADIISRATIIGGE